MHELREKHAAVSNARLSISAHRGGFWSTMTKRLPRPHEISTRSSYRRNAHMSLVSMCIVQMLMWLLWGRRVQFQDDSARSKQS